MATHDQLLLVDRNRVPLGHGQLVAWRAKAELERFCERIEIAGSIRRRSETVKDVEIVCIPKPLTDLFGNPFGDELTDYLAIQVMEERSPWRKRAGINNTTVFGRQNKFLTYNGFPVDIFSTTPERWGMTLFVRTGPREWNIRAMERFKETGRPAHAYGGVEVNGVRHDCPTEEKVFELLGWPLTPPEQRR